MVMKFTFTSTFTSYLQMLSYHATCSKAEVDRLKVTQKKNLNQSHHYYDLSVFIE